MSSSGVLLSLLISSTCSTFPALLFGVPPAQPVLHPSTDKSNTNLHRKDAPDDKSPGEKGELPPIMKELKKPVEVFDKLMEDPIAAMRGELCMSRTNMIGHSKCMDWLVEECTTHSFGTGLCHRVRDYVKKECQDGDKKACEYAKLLGLDVRPDSDGDGVPDEEDAFPNDPKETSDRDGDGYGDNEDEFPDNPKCHKAPCEEPTTTTKPAPVTTVAPVAPAPAPAPAAAKKEPAKEEKAAKKEPAKEEKAAAPAPAAAKAPSAAAPPSAAPGEFQTPDAKEPLQSQGFSGKGVIHEDGKTMTDDWGKEYGHKAGQKPTPKSSAQSQKMYPLMYLMSITLALGCVA